MLRYITIRLASAVPVLLLVTLVTFVSIRVVPGDLAVVRLGESATPESVAKLRQELGLNRPLPAQYATWLLGLVRGNPGVSLQSGLPVSHQLFSRLPVTLELTIGTLLVSLLVALPLGVLAAVWRDSVADQGLRVLAVLGQAMPAFWLAIMALTFLSIYFHWAPPFAYRAPWVDPFHNLKQLLLPTLILGCAYAALLMRVTRAAMLEVLQHDYVRTAVAKGLSRAAVTRRHALRNAAIPIITVVGVQAGTLLGGAIVLEQIFSLPGIGKLTLDAITSRDYTQLQLNVVFIASAVVLINLLVDLSYYYAEPRLRR